MTEKTSTLISFAVGLAVFFGITIAGDLLDIAIGVNYPDGTYTAESRYDSGGEHAGGFSMFGLFALAFSTLLGWRTYRSCESLRWDGNLSPSEKIIFLIWLIDLPVVIFCFELIWNLNFPSWFLHSLTIGMFASITIGSRFFYLKNISGSSNRPEKLD